MQVRYGSGSIEEEEEEEGEDWLERAFVLLKSEFCIIVFGSYVS